MPRERGLDIIRNMGPTDRRAGGRSSFTKKATSYRELSRLLDVSLKSSWFMMQRIHESYEPGHTTINEPTDNPIHRHTGPASSSRRAII